ncbi:aminotransferase class V-fold PLP-dependent enzyme [Streptomyces sp. NBC_00024]|uniref:aminotransferase class V-fold PLP-dependent enzyme n=1 Tax=Streptomyces sp. NBC_00024 TaxID=2903612 RepID=UPI00324687F9
MALSRRHLLTGLGTAATPVAARGRVPRQPAEPVPTPAGDPEQVARDEHFWRTVAQQFRVSEEFTNLENGYYGTMPEPVYRAYLRTTDRLNTLNSHLLRTTYKAEAEAVRERIAAVAGVPREEIALTRGGTEALQNLIGGYNRLRAGDAVMYADLDYQSMQTAMNWLRDRRGATIVRIVLPEPATRQAVLDTYTRALHDHPRVKLLLLSHMNNRTGLVTPVRDIVRAARERGVDVIVDAAHSWGQLDFTIPDLGVDFAGFSLHKWMHAPLGAGFLHIRKSRLADIDRAFADEAYPPDDIRSRVHSGTMDIAPVLSVPAALDFHEALRGAAVKQARLRCLRDRWVRRVQDIDNLEILTPNDPSMYGAITSFRVTGRTSEADNLAIAQYLFDQHRIFTVRRGGPAKGDCVRVTPALFTPTDHIDRLCTALRDVAQRFRV